MFSFTMKTFFHTGLIVYMCFDIVLGVELKEESAAHVNNGSAEAVSSVAGAPRGYWSLRSWVRYSYHTCIHHRWPRMFNM